VDVARFCKRCSAAEARPLGWSRAGLEHDLLAATADEMTKIKEILTKLDVPRPDAGRTISR